MVPVEIKRRIYQDSWREIEEPQILILAGARQVGKTTLMHALDAAARAAGKKWISCSRWTAVRIR